jgi:cysteine desulfurase
MGDRSGESLLLDLAERGIIASSGSACAAGSDEPSHVLTALGIPREIAQTAVRFTLGAELSGAEIDAALPVIAEVVAA